MKKSFVKYFELICCLLCILFIILLPKETILGVKTGINLVLYSMIPSLLPFILIINILIKKKLCNIISKFFYPILKHIFKASQFSSFIIICGFLSGYPLGCKTIFEGLKNNLISEDEAKKLLTFCNNPSISYVINYVSYLCLDSYFKNSIVIMFIFLPPIITGIINSHLFYSKQQVNICNTDNNSSISVLNNTVSSLIKIGMYIIIFTTINAWLSIFISNDNIPLNIITSFMEIISGSKYVSQLSLSTIHKLFTLCIFSITGGICIFIQSISFLPSKSYIKYYIIGKIESLLIFCILFYIYFNYKTIFNFIISLL